MTKEDTHESAQPRLAKEAKDKEQGDLLLLHLLLKTLPPCLQHLGLGTPLKLISKIQRKVLILVQFRLVLTVIDVECLGMIVHVK